VIVRTDRFQLATIESSSTVDTTKALAITLEVVLFEHRIAVVTSQWSHH
jgi:hypothetical protein